MNEFELINRYFTPGACDGSVVLGVGDDAALLELDPGRQLVVSVDTLVADVHFPVNGDPEAIASRALCVSLSDLAAMGAEPLWFTLALTLPSARENWVAAFSRGLLETAREYECDLVGGDTTRGPLAISLQVMGAVDRGQALVRGGASPGDLIYVTGTLGDGAAALAAFKKEIKPDNQAFQYLSDRYYRPVPQFRAARQLVGLASAAIDVSDGLLADLGHICTASGVGAEIHVESLPLSPAMEQAVGHRLQHRWALAGGDDYQLCFTVPRNKTARLAEQLTRGLDATLIGEVTRGPGVHCKLLGKPYNPEATGYNHFG